MRALAVSVVLTTIVALLAAPTAPADVLRDYATTGSLNPCHYTDPELRTALSDITPNVRQYASDYPGAVERALRARTHGACDPTTASAPAAAAVPPQAAPPATATAAPAAPARSGDDDSAAPVVLLVLAGLALLGALLAVALRRLGRGGGRLAPARHAVLEARWRAGGVWADFRDWLSLGR